MVPMLELGTNRVKQCSLIGLVLSCRGGPPWAPLLSTEARWGAHGGTPLKLRTRSLITRKSLRGTNNDCALLVANG